MAQGELTTEQLDALESGDLTEEQLNQLESEGAAPEEWVSVRGEKSLGRRMFDWFNPEEMIARRDVERGLTGSVLDIAGVPEGRVKSALETVGENVVDPVVGNVNALLSGFFSPTKVITEPIAAAEEAVMPRILSEETLNPKPTYDVAETAEQDVTAQIAGHPASTALALLGARSAFKGGSPKIAEFPKAPKEVSLLRGVIKPPAGSKFAKSFDESGSNGLRLISAEAPKKGGDSFQRFKTGGAKTISKLGEERESMMVEGIEKGKTISGKSIKQSVNRLGNDPYYENLDPEGALFFKERASTITDGPIPVQEAQAVYSTVEKMIRRARKASGDAEAALEANDKFQALEAIRENIGKQLNEQLSRTPNEYLNNARNFSDVYRVLDRAEHAEGLFRNDPSNTFTWRDLGNFSGWASFLKKVGMKRTPETDLAASLKRAQKGNLPEPKPIGPQKPASVPQRAPLLTSSFEPIIVPKRLMETFQLKQRFPSLRDEPIIPAPEATPRLLDPWTPSPTPLPKWVSTSSKAAVSPVDMSNAVLDMKQAFKQKGMAGLTKLETKAGTLPWAKMVIEKIKSEKNLPATRVNEILDTLMMAAEEKF